MLPRSAPDSVRPGYKRLGSASRFRAVAERRQTLSVVVVAYDMARELPRTLASLDPSYQRDLAADDYEVIVVDNGSPTPVDARSLTTIFGRFSGRLRLIRMDPAPPSPVDAANHGIDLAAGDLIGLIIDGARIASPRLFSSAILAAGISPRPVITAPAWHLGSVAHMHAWEVGYDQSVEDRLLADSGWESDGYALFAQSVLSGSSGRGIFGPMGESSSLFLRRATWSELGGLDRRFVLPGGGLANHDLFQRACALEGAQLIVLLGEGTFHQFHGGASTSRRIPWAEMHAEFQAIRGHENRPPTNAPLYVGRVPTPYLPHIVHSSQLAFERLTRGQRRRDPEK